MKDQCVRLLSTRQEARKVRFGREEFLSGPTYFGPVIGHPQDRNIWYLT